MSSGRNPILRNPTPSPNVISIWQTLLTDSRQQNTDLVSHSLEFQFTKNYVFGDTSVFISVYTHLITLSNTAMCPVPCARTHCCPLNVVQLTPTVSSSAEYRNILR